MLQGRLSTLRKQRSGCKSFLFCPHCYMEVSKHTKYIPKKVLSSLLSPKKIHQHQYHSICIFQPPILHTSPVCHPLPLPIDYCTNCYWECTYWTPLTNHINYVFLFNARKYILILTSIFQHASNGQVGYAEWPFLPYLMAALCTLQKSLYLTIIFFHQLNADLRSASRLLVSTSLY